MLHALFLSLYLCFYCNLSNCVAFCHASLLLSAIACLVSLLALDIFVRLWSLSYHTLVPIYASFMISFFFASILTIYLYPSTSVFCAPCAIALPVSLLVCFCMPSHAWAVSCLGHVFVPHHIPIITLFLYPASKCITSKLVSCLQVCCAPFALACLHSSLHFLSSHAHVFKHVLFAEYFLFFFP